MRFIIALLSPPSQSSKHMANIAVCLPAGLLSSRAPGPTFPSGSTRCHLITPSNRKPILFAAPTEAVFATFACHCTRRKPSPPSLGQSRQYCNKMPTALVRTCVRWHFGRMSICPISTDALAGDPFNKPVTPANVSAVTSPGMSSGPARVLSLTTKRKTFGSKSTRVFAHSSISATELNGPYGNHLKASE